jgi:hypothetical protein
VVLPRLIQKLEGLGCPRSVAGLTVPLGYSLNLAGTAVYLIVATLFLGEALGIALTPERVAVYLGVMLVTSKAAAGVTGGDADRGRPFPVGDPRADQRYGQCLGLATRRALGRGAAGRSRPG